MEYQNLFFEDSMEDSVTEKRGKGKKKKGEKIFPSDKILPLIPANVSYLLALRELLKTANKGNASIYKQARLFLNV